MILIKKDGEEDLWILPPDKLMLQRIEHIISLRSHHTTGEIQNHLLPNLQIHNQAITSSE